MIVLGEIYRFIFAGPGPDVTVVVPEQENSDGTYRCHDLWFDFKVDIDPDDLIPIKNPHRSETEAYLRYKGEWFK